MIALQEFYHASGDLQSILFLGPGGEVWRKGFGEFLVCGIAGAGGPLVAYRFDGEAILKPDKFVAVE